MSLFLTATTDMQEKGTWGISQLIEYYSNKPFSDLELIQHPEAESQNGYFINYLFAYYGLDKNLTLGISLPYTSISNLRSTAQDTNLEEPVITNLGNSSGIADSSLYSIWRIFDADKYSVSMAFLGGINIPTGATNIRTSQGDLFSVSDQPGSGTWSPFGGLIVTKKSRKFLLSANLFYTKTTEGSQNTTLGSAVNYNLGTVFELYQSKKAKLHLDGVIELAGQTFAKDKIDGLYDPNSGEMTLFLLPGFRVNANSWISVYLGTYIPLVEHYNGIQVKTRYSALVGMDLSF